MDELEISGKRYISSRRAAKEYRYHPDYIGQLVRSKKVLGEKVGRTWYVESASLAAYLSEPARTTDAVQSGGEQTPTEETPTSGVMRIPTEASGKKIEIQEIQKEEESIAEVKTYHIPIHTPLTVESSKPKGLVYIRDEAPLLPEVRSGKLHKERKKILSPIAFEHPKQVKVVVKHTHRVISLWGLGGLLILGLVTLVLTLGISHFFAYTNVVKGNGSTASISLIPIDF